MMAGIRATHTKPELAIRRGLHRRGYRFRLHSRKLPGKPDLVFPRWKAAILVHGCFWHGHGCELFKWPRSREDFWREKITGNRRRDELALAKLRSAGWRVLTIWECAMKGPARIGVETAVERAAEWLVSDAKTGEIRGIEKDTGAPRLTEHIERSPA
jgi:DNA mismatch endonuclease, patch repair protein